MLKSIVYGTIFTLLLVLASLIYILKKSVSKDILLVILHIDKRYLFLSLIAMFLYHTFDNLRLFVLSRAMNLKYSFLYGYTISFINTFGATITPAHMGGEFMSLYTLSRKGGRLHKVMSIVTMKTLTGLAFFILASPYLLFYLYNNPKTSLKILTILFLSFLVFFALYLTFKTLSKRKSVENSKITQKVKYTLKRYVVVSRMFLKSKKFSLLVASLSSILLYVSFLASGALLVKGLNTQASFFEVMEHQLMLLYAVFLSPTPGGSGVGEVGAFYTFDMFLDVSLLGGFSILWRFITQYLSALIGGLLLLFILFKDSKRLKDV
ncbi:MAG: flippase-like domain-containing protein [Aquificaceae bacterium]